MSAVRVQLSHPYTSLELSDGLFISCSSAMTEQIAQNMPSSWFVGCIQTQLGQVLMQSRSKEDQAKHVGHECGAFLLIAWIAHVL